MTRSSNKYAQANLRTLLYGSQALYRTVARQVLGTVTILLGSQALGEVKYDFI
jgi:hypothetical protein